MCPRCVKKKKPPVICAQKMCLREHDCLKFDNPEKQTDAHGCDNTPCPKCIKKKVFCHSRVCMQYDPMCAKWDTPEKQTDANGCDDTPCPKCIKKKVICH